MTKHTSLSDGSSPYRDRLDTTIRPQDDFYSYVNAQWLRDNPMPDSESRWGIFDVLRDQAWSHMHDMYEELQKQPELLMSVIEQQARDFYYTGMHSDDYETAHLALLHEFMIKLDGMVDRHQLAFMIGYFQAAGMDAPWRAAVDADDHDSSVHIFRLHQGGLTLPDRDYYLEDSDKMRQVRAAYEKHLRDVYEVYPGLAPSADALVHYVVGFEMELARVSRSRTELRDVDGNYHKVTYDELVATYPSINWLQYADGLGWQTDDKISVDQPEFLAFIDRQCAHRDLEAWKVYLKWQFFMVHYSRVSERFAALKFEFFGKVLSGTSEMLPQWKRVALAVDDGLGDGVGRLYAERHFPAESKQQLQDMVEQIRTTYADRIQALDWMEQPTKAYALEKLAKIKVLIGYPDKWRDFSDLLIDKTSYLHNVIAAERFDTAYLLRRLHEPTSRDDWFMYPQTVNAYNDPNRAVICFPAAILQAPFYDPKAPLAANMGGIGTVIGHELSHGFDDQGCQFDADGNVRMWQTEADRKAFDARAKLIIDHADSYEVLPGLNLRGGLVIGECIADLGGLELAFATLGRLLGDKLRQTDESELAPAEIFFINHATAEGGHIRDELRRQLAMSNEHPDGEFRVNGILQHVDAWYEIFDVKPDDPLYRDPKSRAKIW